jgi:hypothetical protein
MSFNEYYFFNENIENNTESVNMNSIFYSILYGHMIDDLMLNIENNMIDEVIERTLNETTIERKENDFINFDSIKYKKLSEDHDKECSICLINFEDDNDVCLTQCNHLFHNNCITEWSRYKKDCPICRKNLKE